jgi:hypothetical protein
MEQEDTCMSIGTLQWTPRIHEAKPDRMEENIIQ